MKSDPLDGNSALVDCNPTGQHFQTEKQSHQFSHIRLMMANILESISDDVYALNRNWRFIYVNKNVASHWGYEPNELLGRNVWETFPRFMGTIVEESFKETMFNRKVTRFEWQAIYAEGFRELTVFPSIEGITVYAKDVTERKQLQQKIEEYAKDLEKIIEQRTTELRAAEHLATIGQVAGMVGHDIRNPLQAIQNDLYLLNEDFTTLPECKATAGITESLDMIANNVAYINKIVSDLQDYARPLKPEIVEAEIDEVLLSVFSAVYVPGKIELKVENQVPSKIKTDPMLLRRAVANLVNNGIQAMPDGGKLSVTAEKQGDIVRIVVSDTGVGIPDELKPKLFTPMVTTKSKGQGFGLAASKRLIEAMKGTISFESEEGKGTKFIIELPSN